jgi:hypothetical protein
VSACCGVVVERDNTFFFVFFTILFICVVENVLKSVDMILDRQRLQIM